MDKKKRNKIIALVVVVAVIIAGIIAIAANSTAVNSKLTYLMMPKTLTQPIGNDKEVTFYVRENKDFDAKAQKDSPLEAFEFYYYDENGKEVNLGSEGVYTDGDAKIMPSMLFMLGAMKNANTFKSTYLPIIITVIVIAAIVVGIILWYRAWSKKEDMEKEARNKNKNMKKTK